MLALHAPFVHADYPHPQRRQTVAVDAVVAETVIVSGHERRSPHLSYQVAPGELLPQDEGPLVALRLGEHMGLVVNAVIAADARLPTGGGVQV